MDPCWWSLGGNGFSMPRDLRGFKSRFGIDSYTAEEAREFWYLLIREHVVDDSQLGRVGRPGFFSNLGDSVDFAWTSFFVIESREWPTEALWDAQSRRVIYFLPYESLPPSVLLVARDIDSAYQDYCFRDDWMFQQVFDDLTRRGYEPVEVTDWAPPGGSTKTKRK